MVWFVMEFCVIESCGKCMFCWIGVVCGVEIIDCIVVGDCGVVELLIDLCEMMIDGLLCVFGGFMFYLVMFVLIQFFDDFVISQEVVE